MEPTRIPSQSATPSSQASSRVTRHGSAGGQQTSQAADAGGDAGFLGLLAALDSSEAGQGLLGEDAPLLPSSGQDAVAGIGGGVPDPAQLLALQGLLDMSQVSKGRTVVPADASVVGSGLQGVGKQDLLGGAVVSGLNPVALSGIGGGVGGPSLVAETFAMDAALDGKSSDGTVGPVTGHGRLSGKAGVSFAAATRGEGGLAISATAGKDLTAVEKGAAHQSAMTSSMDGSSAAAALRDTSSVAERSIGNAMLSQDLNASLVQAQGQGLGESAARSHDHAGGAGHAAKSEPVGTSASGEMGSDTYGSDIHSSEVQAPADGFAAMTGAADEDLLAEQISFWANQKLQSAEVTVQRDGQPVEVTVSLQGNEAHVAFRSDQQQTREMIDRGSAQLGALLQEQGLVLSGMTVGASNQQGGGRDSSKSPEGDSSGRGQRGTVLAPVVGTTDGVRRAQTQRVLDVFA